MDSFLNIDALFNAMNMTTPSRSTPEESTHPSPRGWARRRPQHVQDPFDFLARQDASFADIMRGQYYNQDPMGTSRIEELEDYDEAGRAHSAGYVRPRHHRAGYPHPALRSHLQTHATSFSQAARAMHAALVCANQECRSIEASFEMQTRQLLSWLPAAYVNSLWTIRLSCSGHSEQNSTLSGGIDAAARSGSDVITYDGVVQRFNTALAAIKTCAPPDRTGPHESRLPLGWEVLGSTMRKLQISLEAIEELLVLIKTQRDRMPLLLHEIGSAQHLLESVREVWETPKKAGKRPEAKSPSNTQPRHSEHEWPSFSPAGERFDDFGIDI